MKATYHKYTLNFKNPAGTSRGVLTQKETWFIVISSWRRQGIGECSILPGLSVDNYEKYEKKLQWVCDNIHLGVAALWNKLIHFPSIQFGVEMAFKSYERANPFLLFYSNFTRGLDYIPINGLVWMGEPAFMKQQIEEKISQGFTCIKLKIGAIDFKKELALLKYIREHFDEKTIELRVDANGAFSANEALKKLEKLAQYKIHSIEQPIQPKQYEAMAYLCQKSPIPIALDEELIGVFTAKEKEDLLLKIKPQYIILKPSLIGGFRGTAQWISLAEKHKIGWWITSALESNIGLNAIAQYTYTLQNPMPQGLGTGSLYTNNFPSPLVVENGFLKYNSLSDWNFDESKRFITF